MTVWGRLTGLASYLYIFFPVLEVPNIEQRDKMEKLFFFVEGVEAYFFFEFGLFYFYFFAVCSPVFIHFVQHVIHSGWIDPAIVPV